MTQFESSSSLDNELVVLGEIDDQRVDDEGSNQTIDEYDPDQNKLLLILLLQAADYDLAAVVNRHTVGDVGETITVDLVADA